VAFHDRSDWRKTAMGWNVVPDGLENLLLWISRRYNNPKIYITENGSAEDEPHIDAALNDENRRKFYEDHLRACSRAIHSGADVAGYFAWSLMDNYGTCDSQLILVTNDLKTHDFFFCVIEQNGSLDIRGALGCTI